MIICQMTTYVTNNDGGGEAIHLHRDQAPSSLLLSNCTEDIVELKTTKIRML